MFKNVDSQSTQPCCDVIVDESGELRVTIAGDWEKGEREDQLLETLKAVAAFGAPSFVDTQHLGVTTPAVHELLATFAV